MKRFLSAAVAILMMLFTSTALAKMGSGKVSAKSSDLDIKIFGSLHTYPTLIVNPDFNSADTNYDWILDESGFMSETSIRTEARLGFSGTGENWSFLMILEADFNLNKQNNDRGADGTQPLDAGMTGEDFGIEKLEFSYNFGPAIVETGWRTKELDFNTGGLLYGDDHPYIGVQGKYNDIGWRILFLSIFDQIKGIDHGKVIGPINGDSLDWRVYSASLDIPFRGFTFRPFYAFSDNRDHKAKVHYLGGEVWGKYNQFIPRAEFVYAVGDEDADSESYDIRAFAAFASVEMEVNDLFHPYLGGYYVSGDGDANDNNIDAFNPITNISRYTSTFGMENAYIYRYVPVIGSHLYSNVPDVLGSTPGYGGIGNSAKAESPGMWSLGIGTKGKYEKWSYKTQFMYYWFADTGALEDVEDISNISNDLGSEFDFQLTYTFNKHFSLGNVVSVFDPGNGVQDLRGDDYNDTAFLNTIEMKWKF